MTSEQMRHTLKEFSMGDSPTIESIKALQRVIETLKGKDIDPVFIVAALAQVQADMMDEFEASLTS